MASEKIRNFLYWGRIAASGSLISVALVEMIAQLVKLDISGDTKSIAMGIGGIFAVAIVKILAA